MARILLLKMIENDPARLNLSIMYVFFMDKFGSFKTPLQTTRDRKTRKLACFSLLVLIYSVCLSRFWHKDFSTSALLSVERHEYHASWPLKTSICPIYHFIYWHNKTSRFKTNKAKLQDLIELKRFPRCSTSNSWCISLDHSGLEGSFGRSHGGSLWSLQWFGHFGQFLHFEPFFDHGSHHPVWHP